MATPKKFLADEGGDMRKLLRKILAMLVLLVAGFSAGSPLWASGGNPKKGEYWYHEAGCNMCHGEKGRGDGPSGTTLNPRPANYCTSTKSPTDALRAQMITNGGAANGRSPDMPAWGEVLDKQAILDIISYIHVLCPNISKK